MDATTNHPLTDARPRILRPDGEVVLLDKPMGLTAFAQLLGCTCFAVMPLPALSKSCGHDMVLVCDSLALLSLAPVNRVATSIFYANRDPALGAIQGSAAVLPDGHFGGFYPEVTHG